MADFLKRCFLKNKVEHQRQSKVYDVSDYDATFKTPKSVLRLVGLRLTRNDSSYTKLFWSIFYWFEFTNLFVATGLELGNIVQAAKGGTFEDVVQIFSMMPCLGYLCLAMCKSYMIEVHRPVYEKLVNELRDMWPRGEVSDAEHELISTALTQLHYVVRGYYWCNNALVFFFLCPPFVEVIKKSLGHEGTYFLPFLYWLPYDPLEHYYGITLVAQAWHVKCSTYFPSMWYNRGTPSLITIGFMLSGDLLFCIFLSHITTQFDLLSVRIRRLVFVPVDKQLLKSFPLGKFCKDYAISHRNIVESCDNKEWDLLHQQELKEIILRHRALVMLAGDVEAMFSFSLLVNFFNSSIIICFCGFCCVIVEKWNELIYKSFLMTALSQTWLLCWYGQRLLESSARISDALYESGWYKESQSIKRSVLIMLHRSQKKVHVTTYGFSIVSLASYTTVRKLEPISLEWTYYYHYYLFILIFYTYLYLVTADLTSGV